MQKAEFVESLRNRTKQFAINSIYLFKELPKTEEARILGKQFLRSSTSVAANYRAACRARSKAEFFAKLCIAVEEADETMFWLELLIETKIFTEEKINKLLRESSEITAILTKARKTASEN
jgi:four helix bundle protein